MNPRRISDTRLGLLALLPVLLVFCGCVGSQATRLYRPIPWEAGGECVLLPASGAPLIRQVDDLAQEGGALIRAGYVQIGDSSYLGRVEATPIDDAFAQARSVQADVALIALKYEGSSESYRRVTQTVPASCQPPRLYPPQKEEAARRKKKNAEPDRCATREITTYLPETIRYYRVQISYWRKTTPPVLGVDAVDLSPELRLALKRNTGAVVRTVVDGSPAFFAEILPGDVIVGLDGAVVQRARDLGPLALAHAGRQVYLRLIREGTAREIHVSLALP
jgi:hypothetical protein